MSLLARPAFRLSSRVGRRHFALTSRNMAGKQEWMIIIPDYAGALEKRMEVRPKHLEAIKPNVQSGAIVMGGASLDEPVKEGEPMKINGSIMVVCADTKEEALNLIENDIYTKSSVWDLSKMQIYPFKSAIRTSL